MPTTTLTAALCYGLGAYVYDVLWRPGQVARRARAAATRRGKPLLNIGAGTPGSSLRTTLFGPTLWGDVNLDCAAAPGRPGADHVTYGDAHQVPYPDKTFGAVITSHMLEHVDDPQAVMQELGRVADEVYAVVPLWWCPHTWMHPGHQWFVRDGRCTRLRAAPAPQQRLTG